MLLANLPGSDIFIKHNDGTYEGLLGVLYMGVKYDIYPCLIFLGIGATTDFGPLISRPSTMILGAAAQIGIFLTFLLAMSIPYPTMMEGALVWQNFTAQEAASIGIIGGADGPTAVLTTKTLADHLLPSITIAAYSYMALVPFIMPPIIRGLTTKKERMIHMDMTTANPSVQFVLSYSAKDQYLPDFSDFFSHRKVPADLTDNPVILKQKISLAVCQH